MPDSVTPSAPPAERNFVQALGPLDSTMIVAGSMIGSGIFIVSADIARQVGSTGWLLVVWVITGVLTLIGALSYGELAAMMPRAGGQYVYLREAYSPLWGFLYGWTLFLVIQTGTIAAVAVAFARFLGMLAPWVSPASWIVPPINLSDHYAISLSTQQLVAILLIVLLTFINTRGLRAGKIIQNIFTAAKVLSLAALICIGILFARNKAVLHGNLQNFWTRECHGHPAGPGIHSSSDRDERLWAVHRGVCGPSRLALSADAWNNITFTAGEVKNPRRNIPLSLFCGTAMVICLYLLANMAYLCMLPLAGIQSAPDDRVATAAIQTVFGAASAKIMAVAIIISTFGCNNGLILAGARVYYAMARDGLFFRATGELNRASVPAVGLILQCFWACLLVLPRTRFMNPRTGAGQYGNLYSDLLDYVIFAVLIFYVLTIAGLFVLRRKRPDANRPYRAFGYPAVPALYIIAASTILLTLLAYKTKTTWPGLVIVLTGVPVYVAWARKGGAPRIRSLNSYRPG